MTAARGIALSVLSDAYRLMQSLIDGFINHSGQGAEIKRARAARRLIV